MNPFLSEHRSWLEPAPEIEVLDGRSILIVDGESEYQARLAVSYDDTSFYGSEKCIVSAQRAVEDEPLWSTPLPDTMQPPSLMRFRKEYFSQEAVDSIRDAVDRCHGELVLVIPRQLMPSPR